MAVGSSPLKRIEEDNSQSVRASSSKNFGNSRFESSAMFFSAWTNISVQGLLGSVY